MVFRQLNRRLCAIVAKSIKTIGVVPRFDDMVRTRRRQNSVHLQINSGVGGHNFHVLKRHVRDFRAGLGEGRQDLFENRRRESRLAFERSFDVSFAFEGETVPHQTDAGRKLRPIQIHSGLVAQSAADE